METVIFDMDGVLIDSSALTVQIISGLLSTLPRCPGQQPQCIRETFGMSIRDMWNHLLPGMPWEEQKKWSDRYDEEIAAALKTHSVVIPGVKEVLSRLKQEGYRLTVASNCGCLYLDTVLDSQKLRPFFDHPLCLESVGGTRKADILLRHRQETDGGAVMVGDRKSDLDAAHAVGLPCIGIGSPFTGKGELDQAEMVISQIADLPRAVRQILQDQDRKEKKR